MTDLINRVLRRSEPSVRAQIVRTLQLDLARLAELRALQVQAIRRGSSWGSAGYRLWW